jgi:hypothetical protein
MTDDRDILDRAREYVDEEDENAEEYGFMLPDYVEIVRELADALEAARDSASQWEGLWRQDQETAATALRERDQALAEVERLRGNQRVEVVEEWHGLAGRSE